MTAPTVPETKAGNEVGPQILPGAFHLFKEHLLTNAETGSAANTSDVLNEVQRSTSEMYFIPATGLRQNR